MVPNCEFGLATDDKGCPTCGCKICSKPLCLIACPNGYYSGPDGCPTCNCLPDCTNICPYGHDFSTSTSATADAAAGVAFAGTSCRCQCPQVLCFAACPNGYVYDKYGCQTCECVPKYDKCPEVMCALYCEKGYVLDANGCPTCKCIDVTICPAVACLFDITCLYGTQIDERGCPTCKCEPCPAVKCARYCEYGYRNDPKTGCPTCECNEKLICPYTAQDVFCPLKCANGFVSVNGCPTCGCNDQKPCECGPTPIDSAILCPDRITYQKYLDICARTDDNKCYYVQTKCPIGISVTTTKPLTEDDLIAIRIKLGATNAGDVTWEKQTNSDGTFTYTVWVKKEGIPEGRTADDVNNDVGTKARESDPNAASYVLSDGTPQGFGHIVLPCFLGLLSLIFLF
jgi:hypothetical protein